ncbi:MAG: NUDIX hydrolase [Candidatus Dormibacteria bacterium]
MARIVGAQAVIVDECGRVLLQLRPWPPGWEPPGGHVGPGEDPAATVVRETSEECGLDIEIQRLTGVYHFRGIRLGTDQVFLARPVGGSLRLTREALSLQWVGMDHLPRALFPWYRQRLEDALAPAGEQVPERWQAVGPGQVLRHGLALTAEMGAAIAHVGGSRRSQAGRWG